MNLVSIKRTDDMKLEGVQIEAEWRDKQLARVTLTDANGKIVHFALENYCVRAYVQAPPEKKQAHVVTGAVPTLGTPIREEFDDAYAATVRKHELESAGVIENASVVIEEIEIPF